MYVKNWKYKTNLIYQITKQILNFKFQIIEDFLRSNRTSNEYI